MKSTHGHQFSINFLAYPPQYVISFLHRGVSLLTGIALRVLCCCLARSLLYSVQSLSSSIQVSQPPIAGDLDFFFLIVGEQLLRIGEL